MRSRPRYPSFLLTPFGFSLSDCEVTTASIADSAVDSTKLADGAVSYQGIQNVAAARLLGRYDAASGVTQEIALGANLSFDSDAGTIVASGAALADCAVTPAKLADCAVTTIKINNDAIDSSKLADCAVDSGAISDGAVSYQNIQNVTGSRLLGRHDTSAGVVEEVAISAEFAFDTDANDIGLAASGITSGFLADSAVTTAKIADSNVTTAKILDSAVTTIKIADSNITTAKILDSAVTTAKINDGAITNAKLGDTSVNTTQLNDCAVTYAKIQNVSAGSRLLGRHDTTAGAIEEVAISAEFAFDTDANDIGLAASGVTSTFLADCAVTRTKIGDTAITATQLNDCAVSYAKVQNVAAQRLLGRWDAAAGTIQEVPLSAELRFDSTNDWLEVADCGITATLMKDSTITTTQLADCAVTASKLGDTAVTTAKINAAAITTAKIADSSVTLDKIFPGTVGNLITFDSTDGGAVAVSTGNSGQVLTSQGAGNVPTFQDAAAGGDALNLWIPAEQFTLPNSNFAAFNKIAGTNASWSVLDFDATTGESAYFSFQLPNGITVGTTTLDLVWLCSTGYVATTSDGVAWDITNRYPDADEVLDATTTPSENTNAANTTTTANGDLVIQSVTITTTGWAAGDFVYFEITRDVADGNDDLAADARLLGVHLRIQ